MGYNRKSQLLYQLRPYLVDHTGSRSISKVKLRRALLVLRLETTWEHRGAVVFYPKSTENTGAAACALEMLQL